MIVAEDQVVLTTSCLVHQQLTVGKLLHREEVKDSLGVCTPWLDLFGRLLVE